MQLQNLMDFIAVFNDTAAFFTRGIFPFWMELLCAFLLDIMLGDPRWLPHPVRGIGAMISFGEKYFFALMKNKPAANKAKDEFFYGCILCALVVLITGCIAWLIPILFGFINPLCATIARIVLMYLALAGSGLAKEGKNIAKALENDNISLARDRLGNIVGRDTDKLSKQGVARAACESISENTTDGVIAPLFFMLVGYYCFRGSFLGSMAAVLGWMYKAASTMDSMVGYKTPRYQNFGTAGAKLDDFLAYIPARIAGILMPMAAFFLKLDAQKSWNTMLNEHVNHHSPNSGWSEAAAAGALGIKMGGGAYYKGLWKQAPTIGFDSKQPDSQDIRLCIRLMWLTAAFTFILGSISITILSTAAIGVSIYAIYKQIKGFGGGFGGGRK